MPPESRWSPANGAGARRTKNLRGFTLIELLIAIALVALLGGVIVSGSGMFGGSRLRAAAGLVVSAVRLAVTRSNVTGHPVRLVFDLDQQRLIMEETSDRMLRVKDTGDHTAEGAAAGADPATAAEKESLEYADSIVKGPRAPRAKFKAIKIGNDDTEPEKGRELGTKVEYRLVQTEHDSKPRTKGRAYLYFWPGGGTERAVVQIARKGAAEDEVLSVLVSPLTARAAIQHGRVEFQAPRTEDDFGQRQAEQ
jgi:general secretion pathway protein H